MTANRGLRRTIVVFSLAALVGPTIAFLSSVTKLDTASATKGTDGIAQFLYDFVLLIWPPQTLGVIEAVIGTVGASLITVGANVLLFAFLGGLRYSIRAQPALSFFLWIGVSGVTCLFALWASGGDAQFVNIPALLLASAVYAALIWATRLSHEPMQPG